MGRWAGMVRPNPLLGPDCLTRREAAGLNPSDPNWIGLIDMQTSSAVFLACKQDVAMGPGKRKVNRRSCLQDQFDLWRGNKPGNICLVWFKVHLVENKTCFKWIVNWTENVNRGPVSRPFADILWSRQVTLLNPPLSLDQYFPRILKQHALMLPSWWKGEGGS